MSTTKYANPPLVQALFELRYDEKYWDIATPGRFVAKVQSEMPVRQDQKSLRISVSSSQPGFVREEVPQVRLSSTDGKQVVLLGPGSFTVSRLKPYLSWADFRQMIEKNVGVLEGLMSESGIPESYNVVLRYVNRFEAKRPIEDAKSLLTLYPAIPEALTANSPAYLLQMQSKHDTPAGTLLIVSGPGPGVPPGAASLMLDIIFQSLPTSAVPRKDLLDWAEAAHGVIESSFENAVTDEARRRFA